VPMDRARLAADALGLPVMVHIGVAPPPPPRYSQPDEARRRSHPLLHWPQQPGYRER
jgi:predicted amidohydrolase